MDRKPTYTAEERGALDADIRRRSAPRQQRFAGTQRRLPRPSQPGRLFSMSFSRQFGRPGARLDRMFPRAATNNPAEGRFPGL